MPDKDKLKKNGGDGTNVGNALRWLAKQGKTIAPELLSMAGSITGIKALDELANAIESDGQLSDLDKELLLAELEYDKVNEQEISKRWIADMGSDSWLSKNIRPLTLAFLLFSLFLFIILDGAQVLEIKNVWVDLLGSLLVTAVGGYFVIRGGEKIVNKIRDTK
jgi:hypothetical protein